MIPIAVIDHNFQTLLLTCCDLLLKKTNNCNIVINLMWFANNKANNKAWVSFMYKLCGCSWSKFCKEPGNKFHTEEIVWVRGFGCWAFGLALIWLCCWKLFHLDTDVNMDCHFSNQISPPSWGSVFFSLARHSYVKSSLVKDPEYGLVFSPILLLKSVEKEGNYTWHVKNKFGKILFRSLSIFFG